MSATTIQCWLNAGKAEGNTTLRLVPMEANPFIGTDKTVWVNLANKEVQKSIAEAIRQTFGTTSYSFTLDLAKVVAKGERLSINLDSAAFKAAVAKVAKAPKAELTEDDAALLAEFASTPTDEDSTEEF